MYTACQRVERAGGGARRRPRSRPQRQCGWWCRTGDPAPRARGARYPRSPARSSNSITAQYSKSPGSASYAAPVRTRRPTRKRARSGCSSTRGRALRQTCARSASVTSGRGVNNTTCSVTGAPSSPAGCRPCVLAPRAASGRWADPDRLSLAADCRGPPCGFGRQGWCRSASPPAWAARACRACRPWLGLPGLSPRSS